MSKQKEVKVETPEVPVNPFDGLTKALSEALAANKEPTKKNAVNRKPNTPWTPKNGEPKLKLKRKMFQHGISIDEDMETNETIALLNNLKPGIFLNGWVKVYRRRDRGIDIDYRVKTASDRLKLVNMFGIRNFNELLSTCIHEAANPKPKEIEDLE